MKFIVDSNVILSAYIYRSDRERSVILYCSTYGELYIPRIIIDELESVIKDEYPAKAKLFPEYIQFLKRNYNVLICDNLNQENEFLASLISDKKDIPIFLTLFDTSLNPDLFVTKDNDFLRLKNRLNSLGIASFRIMNSDTFLKKFPFSAEICKKLKDNKKIINKQKFEKIVNSLSDYIKFIPIRRINN